jgi:DNA-binding Xre family transcriptional regulator
MTVKDLSETTGIADKTLRRRLAHPDKFAFNEFDSICAALSVDSANVLNFNIDVEALLREVAA